MLIDSDTEISFARCHRGINSATTLDGNFRVDLVASHICEANRIDDMNTIDHPTNLRFPINRFKNSARSGRCNHIVAHALDFHFGPTEKRVVAGDFENNSVRHFLADEGFVGVRVQMKTEALRIVGLRANENMKLFVTHGFKLRTVLGEISLVNLLGVSLKSAKQRSMKRNSFVAKIGE